MKTQSKTIYFFVLSFPILLILGFVSCGGSGKKIAFDPESRDFYKYAQLIMTKVEKDIFSHLPDKEAREEFIADFWAKKDPDPSTEENEYKNEFFGRIEYANKRFREGGPGWKTDRGRIYIYLGPPDKFEEIFTHNEYDLQGRKIRGSILIWVYYRFDLIIQFLDIAGNGKFTFDPMYGLIGSLNEAIEMAKQGFSFQDGRMSQRFLDFDFKYDAEKKEIVVSLPVKGINFLEEGGLLKAEFEFEFYVYEKAGSWRDKFGEARVFAKTEDELLEMKNIIFTFSYDIKPGKYYVDVSISGEESIDQTRKIFEIKV